MGGGAGAPVRLVAGGRAAADGHADQDAARTAREERDFREDVTVSASDDDDSLALLLLCCHPSLAPAAQIPLTLCAFWAGWPTGAMAAGGCDARDVAQRSCGPKQRLRGVEVGLPPEAAVAGDAAGAVPDLQRGSHGASSGAALRRDDLATEAIRLTRELRRMRPREAEVAGLLALMLLARRPARRPHHPRRLARAAGGSRTGRGGTGALIAEGVELVESR